MAQSTLESSAKSQFEAKNFKAVIKTLNSDFSKMSRTTLILLARAYEETKDFDGGIRVLQYYVQSHSNDPKGYFHLGRLLVLKGQKDEGYLQIKLAIEKDKAYKAAYEYLVAEFRNDSQRVFDGIQIATDMIAQFGSSENRIKDLCFFYYLAGYVEQAVKSCKKGISISKDDADNYIYLAFTYKNNGDEEKAKSLLKNAGRRFPASELAQWANGTYEFEAKNYALAEEHFHRALATDGHSARAHLGLALSLFKQKKYKEALVHYRRNCELNKTISDEFKLASGFLLQEKSEWHSKYRGIIALCSRPKL